MRIVLDTNCLLASLSKRGAYFNVWRGLQEGKYTLCVSNEILEEYEWKKIISHTYYNLESDKNDTDIHTEIINNSEELLSEIEKYDLRNLKNNYFTEKPPEKFSRWELTYNYHFKSIPEFERIRKLLDFEKIIDEEVKNTLIDNP